MKKYITILGLIIPLCSTAQSVAHRMVQPKPQTHVVISTRPAYQVADPTIITPKVPAVPAAVVKPHTTQTNHTFNLTTAKLALKAQLNDPTMPKSREEAARRGLRYWKSGSFICQVGGQSVGY
jgi:hypothetical protein